MAGYSLFILADRIHPKIIDIPKDPRSIFTIRCVIGQEILIPAKVVHSVRNTGQTGSQWLYGYRNAKQ